MIDLKLKQHNIIQWQEHSANIIVAINSNQVLVVESPVYSRDGYKISIRDLNVFLEEDFNLALIDHVLPYNSKVKGHLYQSPYGVVVKTDSDAVIVYSKFDDDIIIDIPAGSNKKYVDKSGEEFSLGDYFKIDSKLYQATQDENGFMHLKTIGKPLEESLISYKTSMADLVQELYFKESDINRYEQDVYKIKLVHHL